MPDEMADYLESSLAYFTEEELEETPAQMDSRLRRKRQKAATPKGHCPKCGKHIGRGVAFHMKACKA